MSACAVSHTALSVRVTATRVEVGLCAGQGNLLFPPNLQGSVFCSTPDLQVCTSTHFKDGGAQSEWRIKSLQVTNQVSGKADTGSMVFPLCHASSPNRKLEFDSETWTESTGHSQCQGLGVTVAGCRLP